MAGPPSRGTEDSISAPRGNEASAAGGDQGSAFRSVSRGRGRGRSGLGRGGGGGRDVSGRIPSDTKQSAPLSQGTATSNGQPKGRGAVKAPARPSLAVNVLAASGALDAPPDSPTRSSRRRRPGHRRNVSSMQAKPLAPPLADSVPSSPATHVMPVKDAKDFPPHLAGPEDSTPVVHDLRQEISSLVDHVRTMAMDNKRPDSPGNHIDWAGDDDDSLPDLDDWFATSKRPSDASESEPKTDDNADSEPPVVEVKHQAAVHELQESRANVIDGSHPGDTANEAAKEVQTSEVDQSPPKRERKRERGGRKKAVKVDTPAKKSLLDRLSSPITGSPANTAAGLKPVDAKTEVAKVAPPVANKAPPQCQEDKPSINVKSADAPVRALDKAPTAPTLTSTPGKSTSSNPIPEPSKGSRAFDWADEPLSNDSLPVFDDAPKAPSLDVKPPTPRAEPIGLQVPQSESNASLQVRDKSPRARGQRPQSSDTTPRRQRPERSPHKSHKATASVPSTTNSPNGRRQPHASRPILRVDALDMITRNLRESPARKPSPANSKESA